jgi:F-type H+-transporting ATPase subunit alpha
LFYAGQRPALNVGISVSRVGGDAQTKAMKKVAGGMRLDLAQFRSLAAFAQFGSDLDRATQRQLDRGLRLTELLKQGQYKPLPLADQVALIYAGTNGHLDDVAVERVKEWQDGFIRAFNTQYVEIANAIANEKIFTDELRTKLDEALTQFNEGWS